MAPESRPEEQSSGSDVPAHLLCSPSTCSRRRRRRRPGGRVPSEAALTGGSDQRAPQERQHGSTQVRCSGVCVTTVCVSPYMMRVTVLRFLFKFLFFFFLNFSPQSRAATMNQCVDQLSTITLITKYTKIYDIDLSVRVIF